VGEEVGAGLVGGGRGAGAFGVHGYRQSGGVGGLDQRLKGRRGQ
jgi:hypothetical protein